jgi:3-hydroxybutyryl-CoA dehydrogenase
MDDGLPLVGVIGAGTMGAGIAQVAAIAGHRVLLADAVEGASARAIGRIRERVKAQVARGRLDADPDALDLSPAAISRSSASGLAGAGVVIEAGLDVFVIDDVPGLIVTRTVAMLANLAVDAVAGRVANAADIDTAMRLGVNYPRGPLAWARHWGLGTVLATLDELESWYRDGRYRASPLLRRAVLTNGALS